MIVWRIREKTVTVLCCVRQLYTVIHTRQQFLKLSVGSTFRFSFVYCFGLAFCVLFCCSLDYFVLVLFAFVVLGLVSSFFHRLTIRILGILKDI